MDSCNVEESHIEEADRDLRIGTAPLNEDEEVGDVDGGVGHVEPIVACQIALEGRSLERVFCLLILFFWF